MQILPKSEINIMARELSVGFLNDPLYKMLLQGEKQPQQVLFTFFSEYLQNYYDCMSVLAKEDGSGYTAWFDADAKAPRFQGRSLSFFERVCQYSILDRYYTDNFFVLDLLVVPPAFRGKGRAREIICAFVDFCRENNKRAVVEIFEKENIPLYQKCGFTLAYSESVGKGLTAYLLEYKEEIS